MLMITVIVLRQPNAIPRVKSSGTAIFFLNYQICHTLYFGKVKKKQPVTRKLLLFDVFPTQLEDYELQTDIYI